MTTNRIEFQYDKANDIVIATADWHVKTPADVETWAAQYTSYFARFAGRKVDVIFVLHEFRVDARVGAVWGESRAEIVRTHTRYSYRVGFHGAAKTYTFTSGIRYAASSAVADTIEQAVQEILRHRKEEPAPL